MKKYINLIYQQANLNKTQLLLSRSLRNKNEFIHVTIFIFGIRLYPRDTRKIKSRYIFSFYFFMYNFIQFYLFKKNV